MKNDLLEFNRPDPVTPVLAIAGTTAAGANGSNSNKPSAIKPELKNAGKPVILLRDRRGTRSLETDSIIRIEARSNYSVLFLASGQKMILSRVLKHFERQFGALGFLRIHRSHLVNLSWVLHYHSGPGLLKMKNNETLRVAKRRKEEAGRSPLICKSLINS